MPAPDGWSKVEPMPASDDPLVRGLLTEQRWARGTLSYSFPTSLSTFSTASGYGYGPVNTEPWSPSYGALTATQRDAFVAALAAWAEVADLQFVPVEDSATSVGDLRAAFSWVPGMSIFQAWTFLPAPDPIAADIWFNARTAIARTEWTPGSRAWPIVLHEIGHALGLKHPFEEPHALPAEWDTQNHTVMSYASVAGNFASTFDFHPTTPMLLDVLAIQHAYGPNRTHEAGDSVYVFDDLRRYHETLWDAGGRDTLRYDGARPSEIDLRAGHGSRIGEPVHAVEGQVRQPLRNVWVAWGVSLEDASGGSGPDVITGNDADNVLHGGAGDDRLLGGSGADVLEGGSGSDWLEGGAGDDTLSGGEGRDTVAYPGALASYAIARAGGQATVRHLSGEEGLDRVDGVERLRFGRDELAWDLDGNAGIAYRLYKATLGRTPDPAGLGHHVGALDSGAPLTQIAGNFMSSPEYQAKFGAPDDAGFIALLYRNVLGREPDAGGLRYHLDRLQGGMSRQDILLGFSESPENQAAVIGAIANGIHYTV